MNGMGIKDPSVIWFKDVFFLIWTMRLITFISFDIVNDVSSMHDPDNPPVNELW